MSASDESQLELRIHGVGGSSPAFLLDDDRVIQVAGDETAGFYRRRAAPDRLEAYSWGGLTSGAIVGALWILLLPFSLLNMVGFMFPADPRELGTSARATPLCALRSSYFAGVRIMGLAATVLYTLWFASFFMDEIAFQLIGAFLEVNGYSAAQHAGMRVAIAGGVAVFAVLALHGLALSTRRHYDAYDANQNLLRAEKDAKGPRWWGYARMTDPAAERRLRDRDFWAHDSMGHDLAVVHLAASMLTLVVAFDCCDRHLEPSADHGYAALWAVLALGVLGVTPVVIPRVPFRPLVCILVAIVSVVAALASAIATFLGASESGVDLMEAWALPVRYTTLAALVTAAALAVVLVPSCLIARRGGWAALAALTAVGLAFTAIHAGGGTMALQGGAALARILGVSDAIRYPEAYYVTGLVGAGALLLTVFAIAVTWRCAAGDVKPGELERRHGIEEGRAAGRNAVSWLATIRRAEVLRAAIGRLRYVMVFLLVSMIVIPAIYLYVTLGLGRDLELGPELESFAETLSFGMTALLFVGIVGYWRTSLTDADLRRKVGIVWDVVTFWPRWFHPLAPPVYSQRAIPELQARIEALLSVSPDNSIVISAHSQGSVVAFATLRSLGTQLSPRLALLTHGSPIARLYGFFFPAYFSDAELRALRFQLRGRWTNLWRRTDPIGGPIAPKTDQVLLDPPAREHAPRPGEPAGTHVKWDHWAPVLGHSYYAHDPKYDATVAKLRDQMRAACAREASRAAEARRRDLGADSRGPAARAEVASGDFS